MTAAITCVGPSATPIALSIIANYGSRENFLLDMLGW
jgi:hypothetical protein